MVGACLLKERNGKERKDDKLTVGLLFLFGITIFASLSVVLVKIKER